MVRFLTKRGKDIFKNIKDFSFRMGQLILTSLYFFLPAYAANMAPVLFRWLPSDRPVSKPLFGKNKTWRGTIIAVVVGGLVFYLQKLAFFEGFQRWALIDYSDFSVLLGFLMGLGVGLGDLLKSYYKRKAGISPGERWFPWDQLDFVFGGIIFSWIMYVPPVEIIAVIFLASPLLHIIVNHLAYWLKIRKEKW